MTQQSPEDALDNRRLHPSQAAADLLVEFQVGLGSVMKHEGIDLAELARRMGTDLRTVVRMMGQGANVGLDTVARAFHAVGDVAELKSARFRQIIAATHPPDAAVYVSHATSFDFRRDLYPAFGAGFILPHAAGSDPYPVRLHLAAGNIRAVVAEVSHPSTGQGIELAWAQDAGVPIQAVYRHGCSPSGSLRAVCGEMHSYHDLDDLARLVERLFPQRRPPVETGSPSFG